ncbi:hypothetical protein [Streptobacillus ratti]|uniref:hypothetical protein n=1 Tax=Streptobacillus ratti TaxID=1720557 RepID=UPI0009346C57|nr:hypothetical protein [Streptobacillus ratti]
MVEEKKIKLFDFDDVKERMKEMEIERKEELKALKIFKIMFSFIKIAIFSILIIFVFIKELTIFQVLMAWALFPLYVYSIYIFEEISDSIDRMIKKR